MTDTKTPGDKTLHVSSTKTLTLKRPETGVVRQSFSHGRTKSVVVEKVKRHASPRPEFKEAPAPNPAPPPKHPAAPPAPPPVAAQPRQGAPAKPAAPVAAKPAVPVAPKPAPVK